MLTRNNHENRDGNLIKVAAKIVAIDIIAIRNRDVPKISKMKPDIIKIEKQEEVYHLILKLDLMMKNIQKCGIWIRIINALPIQINVQNQGTFQIPKSGSSQTKFKIELDSGQIKARSWTSLGQVRVDSDQYRVGSRSSVGKIFGSIHIWIRT